MKPCNLHSVQPKLALSPMANFLVYVLAVFSGFVKRLLPGTDKINTSTQNLELPYIKNDSAYAESFLVSEPVLLREYTLTKTEGKLVAFDKAVHSACPDKGGKLVYPEQSRREGSQRGPNRSEKSNRCLQILKPSQKTPSSINFFKPNSMQTKLRLLGITLSVILLSFVSSFLYAQTTETYGPAAVTTDKPDYAPRSNAVFTGSGFKPFEDVVLKVKNLFKACNTVTADSSYLPWTVVADEYGRFVTNWIVCDCPGDSLRLKAVGQTSELIAYAYFEDNVTSVSITSPITGSPISVPAGCNVTINYIYTATSSGPDGTATASVKSGATTIVNGSTAAPKNVTNSTGSITLLIPAGTTPGNYTAEVSLNQQTTLVATQLNAITITAPLTTANAGLDQPVCTSTATLAGNTATIGTGTWTLVSGAGAITTPGSPTSGITGLGTGANTFRWTIASGSCSNSDVVIITRNAAPTIPAILAPTTLCAGGSLNPTTPSVTANGSTVTSQSWQLETAVGSGTFSNIAVPYTAAFADNGKTIRYTATNSCGTTNSNEVTLTVNAAPTIAAIVSPAALCAGGSLNPTTPSVTANGSTVTSQSWQLETAVGSGTFSNIVVPYTAAFADNGKKIRYTAINGCGTTSSNQVTLSVNDKPTIAAIPTPAALCAGGSLNPTTPTITANGSTVSSQSWQLETAVGSALYSDISVPYIVAFADNGKRIRYTATNDCGTTNSNLVTITVNDKPTIAIITAPAALCVGQSLDPATPTVTPNGSTVSSQGWQIETAVASGNFTGLTLPYTVAFADNGKKIRYTATNGCGAINSNEVVVTVNPLPTVFIVSFTGSLCGTANITLSGSETGVNYQLYKGNSTEGSPVAGTGNALNFGQFSGNSLYTVVATNPTTGCTSNMSGSVDLGNGTEPNGTYTVTGGGSYCTGGPGLPVGLDDTETGVNYQLYLNNLTPVGSPLAGTGLAISFGNQTAAGTYTVIGTRTNGTGCSATMTGSVDVTVRPDASVASVTGTTPVCIGATPTYTANTVVLGGGTPIRLIP
jgi:hypothetical protein